MGLFRHAEFQIWCWRWQSGCKNLDMIWACIFLSVHVFCFWCHLLFVFGGSNTRAWRHQPGVGSGWERGACRRVKSHLPSLGLGHVWGTTYVPSVMWKQTVTSLYMSCVDTDPDCFYPLSCPAFPETLRLPWDHTGFSGRIFFFNFHCPRSSFLLQTSLFASSNSYSLISGHWFSILSFSWADHRL